MRLWVGSGHYLGRERGVVAATPARAQANAQAAGTIRCGVMDPFQATMEALTRGLTVGHVATSPLSVAYPKQRVAEVRSWAGPAKINNVPVRAGDGIIGVIENLNGDLEPGPGGWPPAVPADGEFAGSVKRD